MKNKKVESLLYIIGGLLCLSAVLWYISKQREKEAFIDETGIETIGTVIRANYIRQPQRMVSYHVAFDFIHDGNIIQTQNPSITTEEDYHKAIVGRKYKVKYLPENPKVALIYLDEPVYSEDINIEKERERILEMYK